MNFQNLSERETEVLVGQMLDGRFSPTRLEGVLTSWNRKGVTDDEIWGAYRALRVRMKRLTITKPAIDICGTGGDKFDTFNISTATSFVLAAAGFAVAKYGNRSSSSRCGSADVQETLGININLSPEQTVECLNATGFGFFHGSQYHNLTAIEEARRKLHEPTIFNQVLFLLHPARPQRRVLGVAEQFRSHLQTYSEILKHEGVAGLMVGGLDGMDEVSVGDASWLEGIGTAEFKRYLVSPRKLGFKPSLPHDLKIQSSEEGARVIRKIFEGKEKGAPLHALLLNTAATLFFLGRRSIDEGLWEARAVIDSGSAKYKLDEVVRFTQQYEQVP